MPSLVPTQTVGYQFHAAVESADGQFRSGICPLAVDSIDLVGRLKVGV